MVRTSVISERFRVPRLFLAILIFAGLFMHGQETFACELMDGKMQTACCCEAGGEMGCSMGGGCADHMGMDSTGCCEVSIHDAPSLTAAVKAAPVLKALVGDPPQAGAPPPLVRTVPPSLSLASRTPSDTTPASAGTDTYLRTLHLLI